MLKLATYASSYCRAEREIYFCFFQQEQPAPAGFAALPRKSSNHFVIPRSVAPHRLVQGVATRNLLLREEDKKQIPLPRLRDRNDRPGGLSCPLVGRRPRCDTQHDRLFHQLHDYEHSLSNPCVEPGSAQFAFKLCGSFSDNLSNLSCSSRAGGIQSKIYDNSDPRVLGV